MGNVASLYPSQRATAVAFAAAVGGMVVYLPTDEERSKAMVFKVVQLGSCSVLMGIQYWVTFVAGITMMKVLPRHMFGEVQGKLFPQYYTTGVVLHVISAACHVLQYPMATWSGAVKVQGYSLAAGCLLSIANLLFLEPKVHNILIEMHGMEKARGVGNVVGPLKDKELLNNEEYKTTKRSFLKWHGVSMLSNMLTVIVSGINLYCFATRL